MSTMTETLPERVQMREGHAAAQTAAVLPAVQELGKDRNVSEVDRLTVVSTLPNPAPKQEAVKLGSVRSRFCSF